MRYTLSTFATLAALWLLLSGHYTWLHVTLGAASCALVVMIGARMAALDAETQPWHLGLPLLGYWIWLLGQMIQSNIDVATQILKPRMTISPGMVRVPTHEKTELGQTIFANSITLTPGTVSVSLLDGEIDVHALDRHSGSRIGGGEMDRRVRLLEEAASASNA